MGTKELNLERLDMILKMFNESPTGGYEKRVLFMRHGDKPLPADYDKAVAFLVAEGCLEEDKNGFTITYKGRSIINEGGFLGKYRREMRGRMLEHIGIITGIVCGVAGLILSIIALVK